jgi:hypothetical protein
VYGWMYRFFMSRKGRPGLLRCPTHTQNVGEFIEPNPISSRKQILIT